MGKTMKGFYMTAGTKGIFLESDMEKKCKSVVYAMIDIIGELGNKPKELLDRVKNDKPSCDDIQRRIDAATLEYRTTDNGFKYISIKGKNFTENVPENEAGCLCIYPKGKKGK